MVVWSLKVDVVTVVRKFGQRMLTGGGAFRTQTLLNKLVPHFRASSVLHQLLCLQCKDEGWADKLRDQANEGCNISGRIRVNKVIGNIHLSPGRSFQTGRNVYELVPYLRDDGSRHDFSHSIHHLAFEGLQLFLTRLGWFFF